jgi:hypothetical protein
MKNAILLHGAGGSQNEFWIPWLKENLEKKGYEVWAPQLPDTNNPQLKNWLPFVLDGGKFNEETVIVGHSAGCPTILAVLEELKVKIKQAILVAGYSHPTSKDGATGVLKENYNWEKIKSNIEQIIFINSDNDPWGCDDVQGREMLDNIGGIQIIMKGEGHMGSGSFNQPYKEFPLLLKLIE